MKNKITFDLLSEDRIKSMLHTKFLAQKIYAFWSVGSTNEFAYRRALLGEKEGTLVIAEEQTRGRGRKSRSWDSPFTKGLWFSLILRPDLPASKAGLVPYLAGVSVAEAIENYLNLKPSLKWPNDLLLTDKKFCGILSEVEFMNGKIHFIILGIGINVNHKVHDFPEQYRNQATSLRIEVDKRIDRADLLVQILSYIENNYLLINNFEEILSKWKKRCPKFGEEISVIQEGEKYDGLFEEIDNEGFMLLRLKSGIIKKIVAGDILF